MEPVQAIGMAATILTALISVPQVIKSYRTKSTRDLSWGWILLLFAAAVLWITYSLLISDVWLLAANASVFALTCVQAWLKMKYG